MLRVLRVLPPLPAVPHPALLLSGSTTVLRKMRFYETPEEPRHLRRFGTTTRRIFFTFPALAPPRPRCHTHPHTHTRLTPRAATCTQHSQIDHTESRLPSKLTANIAAKSFSRQGTSALPLRIDRDQLSYSCRGVWYAYERNQNRNHGVSSVFVLLAGRPVHLLRLMWVWAFCS